MEFKPAVPKPGSVADLAANPPKPPPADGKTVIIGTPSPSPPPHVSRGDIMPGTPVKKQYMWQLRRARGEKF